MSCSNTHTNTIHKKKHTSEVYIRDARLTSVTNIWKVINHQKNAHLAKYQKAYRCVGLPFNIANVKCTALDLLQHIDKWLYGYTTINLVKKSFIYTNE